MCAKCVHAYKLYYSHGNVDKHLDVHAVIRIRFGGTKAEDSIALYIFAGRVKSAKISPLEITTGCGILLRQVVGGRDYNHGPAPSIKAIKVFMKSLLLIGMHEWPQATTNN